MACIMIVDDNLTSCQLMSRLLRQAGHVALFVLGGDGAMEALAKIRPDLLVLDVNMEDITGLDVLRMIRKRAEFSDLPVVMMSGVMALETQSEACKLGASDYIVKGLDWQNTLQRIELHLPRRPRN